ncbi:MAG: hypothetical protein LBT27_03115 [Prevotellaceae bacterium]|jgi:hypothetical protein|nr:hypothetical protein [Prevotellaceae bacterium]
MRTNDKPEKTILLDSDIISHFVANNKLKDLPYILNPHKCIIIDYVYNEISRNRFRAAFVDDLIKKGVLCKINFPNDNLEIKKEFARIKSENYLIGDGERACMAVAKYNKNIIASSNFRDIAPYCIKHNILYLGTLDILVIATNKEIYTEEDCDLFIQTAIKNNNAKFPKGITKIIYYEANDISFIN